MSLAMPDPVSAVLSSALDGISLRQRVIADNIANVDTPGFRATSVDFESSLAAAIDSGEMPAEGIAPSTAPTQTPVGPNGNNVDLRKESLAAIQSQFQYQVMTRAVSDRSALIKTAAGAV
ncbi:flagellar basal body rod protein FlgB [Nocardioides euryhalodurans]|uniref:Flagellar basal body rod protein FlgB n=1 Tax=Nocardioides euryhalodurans TaxID=2518370 RepID=A0A4P7GKS3_9ACTN|nr:flagellar basal body protein [Nocardioides euryhalodurans]QBR92367.1 flagellar biosynthesis protein FlgB [Nocardioides euryhalodurans]